MLSARWAYMTNILYACERRTCLQMLAVITKQVNCQKKKVGGNIEREKYLYKRLRSDWQLFGERKERDAVLAGYRSVSNPRPLVKCLFSFSPSWSELWGDNKWLMIAALHLFAAELFGLFVQRSGSKAELRVDGKWIGRRRRSGVWFLFLVFLSACLSV